jgi:hypothetical protein
MPRYIAECEGTFVQKKKKEIEKKEGRNRESS